MLGESEQINSIKENGAIPLRKLSRDYFRDKLIRHFNIAFKKHEIEWPTRLKGNDCDQSIIIINILYITLLLQKEYHVHLLISY